MIIYSEILGKQFKTVEDCLAAEEQYNKKLKEEELRKQKEREAIEKLVKESYEKLVNSWRDYIKILDKAEIDVSDMEDKALIFVEVVLDAEGRDAKNLQS